MKKLSLVIPCYNESANIPALLERCSTAFSDNKDVEVILVDNGSFDSTQQLLPTLLPKYPFVRSIRVEKNQGYGFGILSGLKIAKSEYVGWTHADLQTDPNDALKAIEILNKTTEPTFLKGRRYGRNIVDLLFTIGMSIFESVLLRKGLWDINAQPNIFPKAFFERLENPPSDFSLDLFTYYAAKKQNMLIKRFPVYFGKRIAGEAHLKNFQAKIRYSLRTIKYSLSLKKML